MNEALALYEVKSSAAVITINRADKRNALSRGLITALTDAFQRALSDVRLPGGPPRPGCRDGDASPGAPRRRTAGALPAPFRRIDRRRCRASVRPHQRDCPRRRVAGARPCAGAIMCGRRTERAGQD